jgi:hypothetical protein
MGKQKIVYTLQGIKIIVIDIITYAGFLAI